MKKKGMFQEEIINTSKEIHGDSAQGTSNENGSAESVGKKGPRRPEWWTKQQQHRVFTTLLKPGEERENGLELKIED